MKNKKRQKWTERLLKGASKEWGKIKKAREKEAREKEKERASCRRIREREREREERRRFDAEDSAHFSLLLSPVLIFRSYPPSPLRQSIS